MTEIELVIKINEKLYKGIKRRDGSLETEYVCDELMKAIDNGIPLPEGHGKVVDLGKIDKDRIEQYNPIIYLTVNGKYIEAVSLDYLNGLQAIIETDKDGDTDGKSD